MQESPELTVCSSLGPWLAVYMAAGGTRQANLAKKPLGLD